MRSAFRWAVAAGSLSSCFALVATRPLSESGPPRRGTAIVTGGGRGIGAACSRKLAEKGFGVVIAYRADETAAAAVADEIRAAGGLVATCRADVAQETDVKALFTFADSAFGTSSPLKVLVNNAGVLGPKGPLSEVGTADQLHEVMATNVAGPLLCCREAESRMSTQQGGQGGSIVQISSGSAYIGTPLLYAASKGALNSLTIGMIKPMAQAGIRLNTVSPGMTSTDMVAETAKTFDWSQIPLGRIGEPDEIANTVVWLCSDEASYVCGANVRVAGGRPPGTTLG
tara:strand:- start:1285 stop:2139 length:855 start_codon:yes stop_codon:yes gene_type:complete